MAIRYGANDVGAVLGRELVSLFVAKETGVNLKAIVGFLGCLLGSGQ